MHNYSVTRCVLVWIIFGASFRSKYGNVGFVHGAVTRTDFENSYVGRQELTHVQSKRARNDTYFPALEEDERTQLYVDDQGQTQTAIQLLQSRLRYVFGTSSPGKRRRKKVKSTKFWIKPEPFRVSTVRLLENAYDDDKHKYDDDDKYNNDGKYNNDDGKSNDDIVSAADERCSAFLVSFLEGTTDAHDTCEGMMNAYVAAGTSHYQLII